MVVDLYLDGPLGNAQHVLCSHKDMVPQPGLQVALHLGQIEVWARALCQQSLGIVEEVDAKVKNGTWNGTAVHNEVVLRQMPPPWPHHQHCMLQEALGCSVSLPVSSSRSLL